MGQSETFTATITSGGSGSGANGPQGTVEFFDGATELDVAPGETLINNSGTYTATFTTTALAEGSHSITATYVPAPGDPEYCGIQLVGDNSSELCRAADQLDGSAIHHVWDTAGPDRVERHGDGPELRR